MPERFVGPLAYHFGTYYPTGYVVAVLGRSAKWGNRAATSRPTSV